MKLPHPKLTSAHAIALVALFFALGGGAAWAATSLPKHSVGPRQLKDNSVTGAKVRDGSLSASDFAAGGLPTGATGPRGPAGAPGEPGTTGPRGLGGTQGEPGTSGPKGERGPTGEPGAPGNDGARGAKGPQGEPGNDGLQGLRGPQGETGAQGLRGQSGKDGKDGEDGDRGEPGPRGEHGRPGPEGEAGERGARGERGPQGDPGEPGKQGRQGEPGEPGIIRTVVRYGSKTDGKRSLPSYAACRKGESVTGGGFQILSEVEGRTPYVALADRPSLFRELGEKEIEELEEEGEDVIGAIFPAPADGEEATGWAVRLQPVESRVVYQAYVECAAG